MAGTQSLLLALLATAASAFVVPPPPALARGRHPLCLGSGGSRLLQERGPRQGAGGGGGGPSYPLDGWYRAAAIGGGVAPLHASAYDDDDDDDFAFYGELSGGGDSGRGGGGGGGGGGGAVGGAVGERKAAARTPAKRGPYLRKSDGGKKKIKQAPPEPKKAPGEKKKRAMRGTTGSPRDVAFAVLSDREKGEENDFVERLLDQRMFAGRNSEMSGSDRALAREIVYGVVRQKDTLDWLASKKLRKKAKPDVQVLLRMGLYQLFFLDRVPNHAACHETVQLAKRVGLSTSSSFINAILRGYEREEAETYEMLEKLREKEPAVGYSHPKWLWGRWAKEWGVANVTELMKLNNEPSSNFARVNLLRGGVEEVTGMWKEEGLQHRRFNVGWESDGAVFELKSGVFFPNLKSFNSGMFYIQDPSTLLSVRALAPQPGDKVLDLCAAPGGKTCMIAQAMKNEGEILAVDLDEGRLELVKDNIYRLGVTCVKTALAHEIAADVPQGEFDRVLLDAPCSNTGVMRRRIDLRWRITYDEIVRLRETQLGLLDIAAQAVRVGGILVYSTCSIERSENADLVDGWLAGERGSGFTMIQSRQLLPFMDGTDGAFVAALRRDS